MSTNLNEKKKKNFNFFLIEITFLTLFLNSDKSNKNFGVKVVLQ